MRMLTSAPTNPFVRYSSAGRNESSRIARRRIQSCSTSQASSISCGGRHGVGDQDHGRELVDALADPVLALQLVEQVGDGQLVVGVLDLVERRGFRFRRLAAVDLHAVLLPILLRALEHALAHLLLGLSRILAGFTAAALRGCDGEAVAAEGFLRAHVEVRLLLRPLDDLAVRARRVAGLGSARLETVLDLLGRARLLRHNARRVAANLLRRERDGAHEVADLVLLRLQVCRYVTMIPKLIESSANTSNA